MFRGTSAAAAGFISIWAVSAPTQQAEEAELERYGLNSTLGFTQNHDIAFRQNGLLWVAGNEASGNRCRRWWRILRNRRLMHLTLRKSMMPRLA